MGSTNEQITATMGMDLDPLTKALNKGKAGISEFKDRTTEDFNRVATGARSVHRILESISEISPGVGIAISAAFSLPMAGLELFRMGLGAIRTHYDNIKKAAEEATAAQIRLAESRGDDRDAQREIRTELSGRTASGDLDPDAKARLNAIANTKADISEAAERLKQAKADQDKARAAVKTAGSGDSFKELELNYERATARVNDLDIALDHLKDKKVDLELQDKAAIKATQEATDQKKKDAEENARLDEVDIQRKKNLQDLIKQNATAEKQATEDKIRMAGAAANAQTIQMQLTEHFMAPFRPSIDELAKSRGPYARIAQRIEYLQRAGKQAAIYGRNDLVESAAQQLYGDGKDKKGLFDVLRDAKVLPPDIAQKEMTDHLKALVNMAAGKGLNINVPD